jgi:hypothetical protein
MPLTSRQAQELFDALTAQGWFWRSGFLYAPFGTIWLLGDSPWQHEIDDMLERMHARLSSIHRHASVYQNPADWAHVASDTASLVAALEGLLGRTPPGSEGSASPCES